MRGPRSVSFLFCHEIHLSMYPPRISNQSSRGNNRGRVLFPTERQLINKIVVGGILTHRNFLRNEVGALISTAGGPGRDRELTGASIGMEVARAHLQELCALIERGSQINQARTSDVVRRGEQLRVAHAHGFVALGSSVASPGETCFLPRASGFKRECINYSGRHKTPDDSVGT